MIRCYGWAAVSSEEQARSDKESIPAQRREVVATAERLGVRLIDTFEVPGFSRDYIDFQDMKLDMLKDGIDVFARLERLWQDRAIDLFICRDFDRFGRTLAVLAYITSQLVHSGAQLYLVAKNLYVDRKNYATITAMSGLMAEDEVTRLKARYEMGMNGRFARNLPGARVPGTHVLVGDKDHRELQLDASKQPFLRDLADLILAGVPYEELSLALAARGQLNPDTGAPYSMTYLRNVMYHPYTWGHVARHFKNRLGPWAYDETAPLPDGVEIHRNTGVPVYDPDLAARLQAELRRREDAMKGRAKPDATTRYRGLLCCAHCGTSLVRHSTGYYYCCQPQLARRKGDGRPVCPNRAFLPDRRADEQVRAFLVRWIGRDDADLPGTDDRHERRLKDVETELTDVEGRVAKLVRLQASAPPVTVEIYQHEIEALAARIGHLRGERARTQALMPSAGQVLAREQTRQEIARLGVDQFFRQDNATINQLLHRLMGGARFAVDNGYIAGIRPTL